MALVQEWIHRLEEGDGKKILQKGLILLGALALGFWFNLRETNSFSNPESMDTAQVARRIAEGKGFTTGVIRPLSLHVLKEHAPEKELDLEAHPELTQAPLYPFLLGMWLKVAPVNYDIEDVENFRLYQPETWIAGLNSILFLFSLYLLFSLARKLFDEPVAWIATFALLTAEYYWRVSAAGLGSSLSILLVLGLFHCWVATEQRVSQLTDVDEDGLAEEDGEDEGSAKSNSKGSNPWVPMIFTGLLLAVIGLTQYSLLVLQIPLLAGALVFFSKWRWKVFVVWLALPWIVLSPWLVRNISLSGHLFGLSGYSVLADTQIYQDYTLERSLHPFGEELQISENQVEQSGELYGLLLGSARKIMVNLSKVFENNFPNLGGHWIAGLFVAAMLVPFQSRARSRMRWVFLFSVLTVIPVQALIMTQTSEVAPMVNNENLLGVLGPVAILFGAVIVWMFISQVEFPISELKIALTILVALLGSLPFWITIMPPKSQGISYPPYYPPQVQQVGQWMEPGELMASDMPWAVAWYGDRTCLWLPAGGFTDFYEINDFTKTIQGLYLTPLTLDNRLYSELLVGDNRAWGNFVLEVMGAAEIPQGFPLKFAPQGFLIEGNLFLTDRKRW